LAEDALGFFGRINPTKRQTGFDDRKNIKISELVFSVEGFFGGTKWL